MQLLKRYFSIVLITLSLGGMLLIASPAFADSPPPPTGHGQTGNQVPGGGASVGGGFIILALLGLGYGAKKYYDFRKNIITQE